MLEHGLADEVAPIVGVVVNVCTAAVPMSVDDAAAALGRFVTAQHGVWDRVQAELASGRKTSHWMWFVFPQLRGLGRSAMAEAYGIASLAEARAYLAHPLLGPRLVRCTELALAVGDGRSAHAIFGSPDDVKFRSSLTLFAEAAPPGVPLFRAALERFFGGSADDATLGLLARQAGGTSAR